jgi:hypothetical protein
MTPTMPGEMELIDVMRRLSHWLRKNNINPEDVRLVLEFDKGGDANHATHSLMAELSQMSLGLQDLRKSLGEGQFNGIRYKLTTGEYRR